MVSVVARRRPKARRNKRLPKAICLFGAAQLFEESPSITMTLLSSGGEQSFEQNTVFMLKSARPPSKVQPASLIWKNDQKIIPNHDGKMSRARHSPQRPGG